jgi:uncharacterized protein (TIGR03118 family)
MNRFLRIVAPASIAAVGVLTAHAGNLAAANAYDVTNLVSDQATGNAIIDRNLKNAWGVAFSPAGSPFWVADNATGKSTLYMGDGTIVPLVVKIPRPGGGISAPTGIVWNPTSNPATAFLVPGTKIPAAFIFDSEDGTLAAWAQNLTPNNNRAFLAAVKTGAVYKGLAFGVNAKDGALLFATDFHGGTIDVYKPHQDSSGVGRRFEQTTTSGGFVDPKIPSGFAPFGIQNIDGNLIVTYAKQDAAKHDDVAGDGHGFVDAFDTDGNLLKRLATRGGLNSPWGVARASFAFGPFSGDLLIGNFGNGWINALTPGGKLVLLMDQTGNSPLFIDGLWTLTLGGGAKSNPSTLYFTAGPNGEANGRFGTITPH